MFADRKPYQGFNLVGRLKALGIHFLFSIAIFLVFLWVFLTYWFPAPHFQINGGWQGVRIMILVDLIIGPALTFVLYNNRKSKKELRFDLGLIVVFQVALLVYGLNIIYSQRPAAQVVSYRGQIHSPRYEDLIYSPAVNPRKVINGLNAFNTYPPTVYGDYLEVEKKPEFSEVLGSDLNQPINPYGPFYVVSTYRPMSDLKVQDELPEVADRALLKLIKDEKKKKVIEEYQEKHGEGFYFFRFLGEFGEAIAVLDETGKPIDYIDIHIYE